MAMAATWSTDGCFRYASQGTLMATEPVTASFPTCNAMLSTFSRCDKKAPKTAIADCLCDQTLFNDIYGCENEWRSCLGSDAQDSGARYVKSQWHKTCDSVTSPTTPVPEMPQTTEAPVKLCHTLASACNYEQQQIDSCYANYNVTAAPAKASSCLCQYEILSAASVCEFDGNKTCLQTSAALSNIQEWTFCAAQTSAFLSLQSAVSTGTSPGPFPISKSRSFPPSASSSQSMSLSTAPSTTAPSAKSTTMPMTGTGSGASSAGAAMATTTPSRASGLRVSPDRWSGVSLYGGAIVLTVCLQQLLGR